MTRFLCMSLFILLGVFLEISANTMGLNLVLAAPPVFYFAYVYGPKYGIAGAVIAGMTIDFCYGVSQPWSVLSMLLVAGLALFWLYRVESDSLILLLIPGLVIPALAQFPASVAAGGFNIYNIFDAFSDSVFNGMICSVFFPFLIMFYDFFGGRLDLGVYGDAKERLVKER